MRVLGQSLLLLLMVCTSIAINANPNDQAYLIGRGMGDVTGPAYGNPMWGYSKPGQNTEGIHTRLKSRAFIFVDPQTGDRLLFASVDIGSIEHHIFLEVVDRLQVKFGDLYRKDNTILSATHTHSGPDNYYHTRVDYGMLGPLHIEHFNRIVSGIVASIEVAHNNLQPGNIFINKGDVVGAGANRSMTAYDANPVAEREKYNEPMDLEMTLLRLQGRSGAIGSINWFAVHPTSMTYNNRLISSDHKGYASITWENSVLNKESFDQNFIAAFAQSTPGDVTPNLNLDNTGPGKNDIDSTQIIGQIQLDAAQTLFDQASEKIIGPIASRQMYVDMSNLTVSDEFTGAGNQVTCPSAYGYAFAAGSTEDGGGHFLFSEGMKEQSWWLDIIIRAATGTRAWTQAVKDCQSPKAILFEPGSGEVPEQSQIRSLTIARLGSLAIVAMPTEVTTMSARRIRSKVKAALGPWVKHIVIAGYSNGSAGYVTTPEEYETQQYEGGHTRHGKWSLPAYQQVLSALAVSLNTDSLAPIGPDYDDWRGKAVTGSLVGGRVDSLPAGKSFGDLLQIDKHTVKKGEQIRTEFLSGHPSTGYRDDDTYVEIEKEVLGEWVVVHTDVDWSTIIRWEERGGIMRAEVSWTVPHNTQAGTYRIKHLGNYRLTAQSMEQFEAASPPFEVIE
jgi:neutral ceramidase